MSEIAASPEMPPTNQQSAFQLHHRGSLARPTIPIGLCQSVIVSRDYGHLCIDIGDQKVYFYFFKRSKRYNKEVLSHSFICLLLPFMEGIVLLYNINLYCIIAIIKGHW